MAAYWKLMAETTSSPSAIGANRTKPGTLNAAIVAYYASPAFNDPVLGLAKSTQDMRRAILERWRGEDGEKPFAGIKQHHIINMLSSMKPHAQKNWLKTIRGLMQFAVAKNLRGHDPTQGIKLRKAAKSMGHMTWLEPQIEQYRQHHLLGTVARLALELLLNIAARRHDAHDIGRQHVCMVDGKKKLRWRPHKTIRSTAKMLSVDVLPELQAALDAMPTNDNLTFLVNDYGKKFASAAAFGNKFANWCVEAGLKPVMCDDGRVRNYRAHGLRKAALRLAAHAGCTGPELMALSGHATLSQLQVYLDEVEQEQLAEALTAKRMAAGVKMATQPTNLSTPTLQTGS